GAPTTGEERLDLIATTFGSYGAGAALRPPPRLSRRQTWTPNFGGFAVVGAGRGGRGRLAAMSGAADSAFARFLVRNGLMTEDHVRECIRVQERYERGRTVGEVAVMLGYLTSAQLDAVLDLEREVDDLAASPPIEALDLGPLELGPAVDLSGSDLPEPLDLRLPGEFHVAQAPAEPPPATVAASRHAQPAGRPAVAAFLEHAVSIGASDVHLQVGSPPFFRVHGQLGFMKVEPRAPEENERDILEVLDAGQRERLLETGDLDFVRVEPGLGRFRGSALRTHRGIDVVFRVIPERIPTLADLGLPADLAKLVSFRTGLVLVTGPAGCGKTTTLAALVDLVNKSRQEHVITVEDPVEFVHASRSCIVSQREAGRHTRSFGDALRAALREDPDVIVVGEMRDMETISLAITAAETGHLVLATLHTGSAIRTVNRILGVFPPAQQPQIRSMVSDSLRAVVSQRLIRRADGRGRVAAVEILLGSPAVANLIREEKTHQLASVMQVGRAHGMRTLDDSLQEMVARRLIAREAAAAEAEKPELFAQA
ncbi:MAG: PilT/PilU family type 4a pilus ATPase, partial [Myxococcota bacterium]|nr:PilT/PilU family type 4a pilus ATPase [Myxococcota bacterium]